LNARNQACPSFGLSSTLRSGLATFVATAITLVASLPAAAQGDSLPTDIRRAPQLTPAQEQAVQSFIKQHVKNLASDNPQFIKRDRNALLEPLADLEASPKFRFTYAEALLPTLETLAANANDMVVINAMVLAGDLATAQGVNFLTKGLAAAKPAVRYQAAFGLRRTFEALAAMPSPTVNDEQRTTALESIAGRIKDETDAVVLDGLVYAALEATKAPAMRNSALTQLGRAMAAKVRTVGTKAAPDSMAQVLLRAGAGLRDSLAAAQVGQISDDAVMASADAAGAMIAYCAKALESKSLPAASEGATTPAREVHAQLATTCENVLLLGATLKNGASVPGARKIGDKIRAGTAESDQAFLQDARALVGRDGLLSKPPFGFAPDSFLDK
jgi:hypothetical protein